MEPLFRIPTEYQPRPYQKEACDWALAQEQAVCCLPTGMGKTFVGLLWVKELIDKGKARRVLLLEPTRLLIQQTKAYYLQKGGIKCQAIDGTMPRKERQELWADARYPIVISTPETAYNDRMWLNFDAAVIDECHHTVGQDAFAKLMDKVRFPYRLGLSATVPAAREHEVAYRIGRIRRWSWEDETIKPHVPNWIGEVYDSELSKDEADVMNHIRSLKGGGLTSALLERYLVRDGSLALSETLRRATKLAADYRDTILPKLSGYEQHLHKLGVLKEVLDSHDFSKALVFTDRRVIAHAISKSFPALNPAVLLGGDKAIQARALEHAKSESCRLVVTTSAGEEGLDLPELDLVIWWGGVASEIRFVQRLGRLLRMGSTTRLKHSVFMITPDSVDYDSFLSGLERAQSGRHLDVAQRFDVERTFGWDPQVLWPKTTWWHLTEELRGRPRTSHEIGRLFGVRESRAQDLLSNTLRRGRTFYFYDVDKMVRAVVKERIAEANWSVGLLSADEANAPETISFDRAIAMLRRLSPEQTEWLREKLSSANFTLGVLRNLGRYRMYALSEECSELRSRFPEHFASGGEVWVFQEPFRSYLAFFLKDSVPAVITDENRSKVESIYRELVDGLCLFKKYGKKTRKVGPAARGFSVLSGTGKQRLKFYFIPSSCEVLSLLASNAVRLTEVISQVATAARQSDLEASLAPWLGAPKS